MKYLKLFEELYGNAGSMYGWDKTKLDPSTVPLIQYPVVGSPILDPKKVFPYKCNNCDTEFYAFEDELLCHNCGSEDVDPMGYNESSKSLTHKREVLDDIKDILLEASDLKPGRISASVKRAGGLLLNQLIEIKVDSSLYMIWSEFEDVIDRLYEYFNIHHINVSLFYINDDLVVYSTDMKKDDRFRVEKINIYIDLTNTI